MIGAIFMKFGRAPAMRSISTGRGSGAAEGDGGAADFDDLIERNGRRQTVPHRAEKLGRARRLTLVLPPQPHAGEAGPRKSAEQTEVVELQHPSAGEHLQ